jgi:hypothetical protein
VPHAGASSHAARGRAGALSIERTTFRPDPIAPMTIAASGDPDPELPVQLPYPIEGIDGSAIQFKRIRIHFRLNFTVTVLRLSSCLPFRYAALQRH